MLHTLNSKMKTAIGGALVGAFALLAPATQASADADLTGKKVIFVPITMGISLTEGWARRMREHAETSGYTVDIRDAAFNTGAMAELLAKAISDKPDVIVVHNPTVQLLARQIKQAEAEGIKVLQLNLQSNQPSSAFVGANWDRIGREIAEDIVKECGEGSGKSGKVAIIPGQLTAADSVMMNAAAMKVFEGHKIEVVSNQASDWEPEKARQITATVLQQHPDLCAIFGHWDVHTMGAGNAVKDAGLADNVMVYATGGGDDVACKAVEDKVLDRVWSYDADGQGRDAGTMIDLLLQGAVTADGSMLSVESPMKIIKAGDSYDASLCWKM
ncbi:monosaccharide ABC transporter substrate-binding protein (CUT2 family) [Hoeflea marina]|uniref:Monosaccharide ABC transporter substrate-binding protein (CUT2 family) n=1 Tax=Hoeflea marina TaxID=274592 RepID=A0A317PJT5_9HYPH|nr:sugar ABC transporter substrate-binding protein [Hoeflea marina]PWV97787.1 monosaccharide ABC transporter substrate-binding protein (CUT2 family) [Hoeflea marina]